MNFSDEWAEDENGKKFLFTVEMKRQLFESGLPITTEALLEFKENHAPPPAPNPKEKRSRREDRNRDMVMSPEEDETDEATGKTIGVLKSYNSQKGFGFIGTSGDDIYFHRKKALDDPRYMSVGQKVLYNTAEYRGKTEAVEVEEYEEIDFD